LRKVRSAESFVLEVKTTSLPDYYAARAPEYERIYHKPERQADLAELRSIISKTFARKAVLEIACGTGYWTQILSECAAAITALDLTAEVLEIARTKTFHCPVRFLQADAYKLPHLPPMTGCLAAFWWSHIPKNRITTFLKGLHATLPEGATVLFIDNRYVEGSSTPISRVDAEGNSYQARTLNDGSAHEVLKNFPAEDELLRTVAPFGTGASVQLLKYFWTLHYRAAPRRAPSAQI
jgi:demethylmenaquinone methyltransferase/2-methoxy-6-polyprenyl-1,4-benzoquinol methylase